MATGCGRLDSNRSGCRKQKPFGNCPAITHCTLLQSIYRYHCHINMKQLGDLLLWHHPANSSILFVMRVRWLHLHILFNEKKNANERLDMMYCSEVGRKKKSSPIIREMGEMGKVWDEKLSVNLTYMHKEILIIFILINIRSAYTSNNKFSLWRRLATNLFIFHAESDTGVERALLPQLQHRVIHTIPEEDVATQSAVGPWCRRKRHHVRCWW